MPKDKAPTPRSGVAPADRPPTLKRVRSLIMRNPAVVRIAKDLYRWPALTRSKPYRWAVERRVEAADRKIAAVVPRVSLETVLTCNAKCTMCVHSSQRMVGVMSMDLFARLIDECVEWGVQEVGLSVYGEPLVDKHWLERVKMVRDAGLRYHFFSNASLLTEDKAQAMLELGGWTEVNFSVNGFSKDVYEAVMPPLSRERVYGNIERFLALRERYAERPEVTVSCVVLKQNVHELDAYRDYWSSRVDRVSLPDRSDWLGELQDRETNEGVNNRLRVLPSGTWLYPCPTLWGSMFVYYDGRVAPCCEDAGLRKLIIGDTNERSLREIFLGAEMEALRAGHRRGQRCDHDVCGRCHVNWPWL